MTDMRTFEAEMIQVLDVVRFPTNLGMTPITGDIYTCYWDTGYMADA